VLHALPISSSLTWSFQLYLTKSASYDAPHYAVFNRVIPVYIRQYITGGLHKMLLMGHWILKLDSEVYQFKVFFTVWFDIM
jgi:hypothetical protein